MDRNTFLISLLDQNKSPERIKAIQSKIGGKSAQVGKNRYFMFYCPDSPQKVEKIQTLIDKLATDDESFAWQKTVVRN